GEAMPRNEGLDICVLRNVLRHLCWVQNCLYASLREFRWQFLIGLNVAGWVPCAVATRQASWHCYSAGGPGRRFGQAAPAGTAAWSGSDCHVHALLARAVGA